MFNVEKYANTEDCSLCGGGGGHENVPTKLHLYMHELVKYVLTNSS